MAEKGYRAEAREAGVSLLLLAVLSCVPLLVASYSGAVARERHDLKTSSIFGMCAGVLAVLLIWVVITIAGL